MEKRCLSRGNVHRHLSPSNRLKDRPFTPNPSLWKKPRNRRRLTNNKVKNANVNAAGPPPSPLAPPSPNHKIPKSRCPPSALTATFAFITVLFVRRRLFRRL